MKVVIADDEHLVRYSLKSMIEELDLGLTVVAEASDGEGLLTALARFQPELCFVDIRMPGLGGLAAIRKARKTGSKAKWIILTSHAEFEYASEALQLGASAYLLKPAGPTQLAEVLVPLVKAAHRERREESVRFEHALVAALSSPGSVLSAPPVVAAAWLEALRIDARAGCSPRERGDFAGTLVHQLRETALDQLTGSLVTAVWLAGPDQVLVTAGWYEADADGRNAAAHLKELVGITVKQSSQASVRLTGFVAEGLDSWEAFRAALDDLGRVVPHRIILGTCVCHSLGVLQRRLEALPPAVACLPEQVEAFIQTRERGEIPALEAQAQALRDAFAAAGSATAHLEAAARYLAFRTGLEPPPASTGAAGLVAWADGLVTATRAELPDLRRAADFQSRVVEKVDQYLRQNLRSEVRVPDIASVLGLSPNYLSTVYHRLTQSTISERLADLRLDLSRELLARPGSQVKEVAAAVGYKSTRYFARLYHKRFGHYPSGR